MLPMKKNSQYLEVNRSRSEGNKHWCIAKKWRWVYAMGRGKGPEGTLLIYDH